MFPWQEFDTVLFEKGISLQKEDDDQWRHRSASSPIFVNSPHVIHSELRLRPIVVIGLRGNSQVTLLLPATQGRLLDIYLSELAGSISRSLSFVMGALLYYCKSLAQWYADQCLRFALEPLPIASTKVVTTPQEPYFEFESLVTTVVRGYDTLRYALWEKWGSKGSCPNSFDRTVARCQALPQNLQSRLQTSSDNFYTRAKEYRDCIQHYVDFGSTSWAMMEFLKESFWSVLARIPDNPEVRSARLFQFHRNIDALTLGWELSTEFFGVIDITLGSGSLSTAPAKSS